MSEKLCILDEWFYKPHQFCQVEVEKGEINEYGEVQKVKTQSTVFTRNACNVLMQHVHNEIEKCENKDSINADHVFSISMGDFLDRVGGSNTSQVVRNLKLIPSLIFTIISKNGFHSISLFPEVSYSKYDDTLKFKTSSTLINMAKNDYKPIDIDGNIMVGENSSYARIYLRSSHRLSNNDYKTMALYEYFIYASIILRNSSKRLSIKIENLLRMTECSSYTKPSQIIKTLESICNSMLQSYGLLVYYKCNYDRKYSKITSVSFRVYIQKDNLYSKHIHTSPQKELSDKKSYYFLEEKDKPKNIFKFKSKEEHELLLNKKYTNVEKYNHPLDLESTEEVEELL